MNAEVFLESKSIFKEKKVNKKKRNNKRSFRGPLEDKYFRDLTTFQ